MGLLGHEKAAPLIASLSLSPWAYPTDALGGLIERLLISHCFQRQLQTADQHTVTEVQRVTKNYDEELAKLRKQLEDVLRDNARLQMERNGFETENKQNLQRYVGCGEEFAQTFLRKLEDTNNYSYEKFFWARKKMERGTLGKFQ